MSVSQLFCPIVIRVAERVGFEPTDAFGHQRFSGPLPSTARTPLHIYCPKLKPHTVALGN